MALLERARADLTRYPEVAFCEGEATAARRGPDGRFVLTVDGAELGGLRLIMATGVVDQFPEIDGFFEHYGTSVFHCATCDRYQAQGRSVVILGWGEQVVAFAVGLPEWAGALSVVPDGRPLEGDDRHRALLARHGIGLVEDDAIGLVGDRGDLRGCGGDVLDAELVFFNIAHHPCLELASQLGCDTDDSGCLCVDRDGSMSVDGCYTAGDVTPGIQLVPVAVGMGPAAAPSSPNRRPTPPPSWASRASP